MPIDIFPWSYETVETILRRRGHLPVATGDVGDLLFPEERLGDLPKEALTVSPGIRERYHELFGRASFRKVARQLIIRRGSPCSLDDLCRIAGAETDRYVAFLEELQVVEQGLDGLRLTRDVDNIGPSLEHYVAQLCSWADLRGHAEWGVKLAGLPRAGGDYDVLAWLAPTLLYVECKAKHQEQVAEEELRQFLQRHVELAPDLSVLLVDTDDDLAFLHDRFNSIPRPILQAQLQPDILVVGAHPASDLLVPQRNYLGVSFSASVRVYVTNSAPSILTQLRRCLQHYHAIVRGQAVIAASPLDFLTPGTAP